MAHEILWANNDNDLLLDNLTFGGSTTKVLGATVTAVVKNGATTIKSGISCTAASTSSNDYKGLLSSTVSLPIGKRVKITYTVVSSSGSDATFVKEALVRERSN